MDISESAWQALGQVLNGNYRFQLGGQELEKGIDTCQFVEKGSTAIRWDGMISPCLPLLHTNINYMGPYKRNQKAHLVGSILERSLLELWNDPDYVQYRERVRRYTFAPCTYCTGCELAESNEEDCLNNPFPVCGGCLWAQGIVQCP